MIKPNTAVLQVGGRKSLSLAPFRPLCKKKRNVMGCDNVEEIHPSMMPDASAASVSNGSISRHAITRVDARNLYGFTAETSIASICSVTLMDPSSAPMPAPTRPLTMSAVMTGPLSLMSEKTMTAGSMAFAPKRVKLSRVCKESTMPVAAPARATSGNDFDPMESICRINSRPSQGAPKVARATRAQKSPNSPNHSKNVVSQVLTVLRGSTATQDSVVYFASQGPTHKASVFNHLVFPTSDVTRQFLLQMLRGYHLLALPEAN